jgi:putative aldouronate transport system substrate-binding protein
MKWIDFFYCDQGTIFGQFGEEGVTFNYNAEGYPVCIDEILNSKDGTRVASFQWVDNVYGGFYPYLDIDVERRLIAWNSSIEYELKTTEDINQYVPEDGYWANFLSTPEEADDLAVLSTDLSAYVDEMRPKFITGELNLDRDFDAYVTRMKQMGADKYIEIRQKQLDRMMAQK